MSSLEAILLGVIQGLTEFLPISSDGHLAIAYRLIGDRPDLTFEVFLHAATLLAMVIYFRRDIVHLVSSLLPSGKNRTGERKTVLLIIVGTFVSGVLALALSDVVEPMAGSMAWVAVWLFVTSALLITGEWLSKRNRPGGESDDSAELVTADESDFSDMSYARVLFIGVLQGTAVLPGLSRSGSTIAAGLMSGLTRERAARFSFLLGIPIITLAAAKDAVDLIGGSVSLPPLPVSAAGFLAAGLSGYLAIAGLLGLVKRHSLLVFAVYTATVGGILLIITYAL